jgi:ATP:corrinoid adenosyltransferase
VTARAERLAVALDLGKTRQALAAWNNGLDEVRNGEYDVLILDKSKAAVNCEWLCAEQNLASSPARPPCAGVVRVGRDACCRSVAKAGLVVGLVTFKDPYAGGAGGHGIES